MNFPYACISNTTPLLLSVFTAVKLIGVGKPITTQFFCIETDANSFLFEQSHSCQSVILLSHYLYTLHFALFLWHNAVSEQNKNILKDIFGSMWSAISCDGCDSANKMCPCANNYCQRMNKVIHIWMAGALQIICAYIGLWLKASVRYPHHNDNLIPTQFKNSVLKSSP